MAVNNLDEGVQGQGKNSSREVDPELALLQDTWLESELEVIDLRARKRKGESVGEVLAAAKKRRNVLWKQLLGEWKKGWKRERKSKSKVTRDPAVPVEQGLEGEPEAKPGAHPHPGAPVQSAKNVEMAGPGDGHELGKLAELGKGVSVDLDETYDAPPEAELEVPVERSGEHETHQPQNIIVDLDEFQWSDCQLQGLEEVEQHVELGEPGEPAGQDEPEDYQSESEDSEEPDEPPHKRTRLEAIQPEVPPRSENSHTRVDNASLTVQQKYHIRALICKPLSNGRPPLNEVELAAQAAGLTTAQVRDWVNDFYRRNPKPTFEQAMTWRSEGASYRDVFNEWLAAHCDDTHPNLPEKMRLAHETGKSLGQVDNWFRNARKKRGPVRNRYSPDQTATLNASFDQNAHPSAGERERLARETGLSLKQVISWFSLQRKREGLPRIQKTVLSAEQKAPLFAWLHANMEYPRASRDTKNKLAEETGLTYEQVKTWFSNSRREIERNQGKKSTKGAVLAAGQPIYSKLPQFGG